MKKILSSALFALSIIVSCTCFADIIKPQTTECKANEYLFKGKCMPCQTGGVCDGKTLKCLYGQIVSNGAVACNYKPGYNYSCLNLVVKDGKCADVTKCKTNHYLVGTECVACPKYGTCEGDNVKCLYGYTKDSKGRVECYGPESAPVSTDCAKNQYFVAKVGCVACPKLATCDGKTAKCKSGYDANTILQLSKGVIECVPHGYGNPCKSNQYLVGKTCAACPANATCDGKTATCKKGFATDKKNGKVACKKVVKRCKQSSHDSFNWIKSRYKNCSKCEATKIAAGKCSKNKKAHKHYTCECDC